MSCGTGPFALVAALLYPEEPKRELTVHFETPKLELWDGKHWTGETAKWRIMTRVMTHDA